MSPKGVHDLLPRTCEWVTLHGKRDFADVMKLGTLRWADYPGLSGWAQSEWKRLGGGGGGDCRRLEGEAVVDIEGGGGAGAQECEASGSWERHRNAFSLRLWSPILIHPLLAPANTSKQFSDTSWMSHNLTQFWRCLPGDSIRSHRLRAQPHKTALIAVTHLSPSYQACR